MVFFFSVYLQQALNDTVGKKIVEDFVKFNWTWVTDQQKRHGWGPLTSNLLLVAPPGKIYGWSSMDQNNFLKIFAFNPNLPEPMNFVPIGAMR